jgi:magnesium transporter
MKRLNRKQLNPELPVFTGVKPKDKSSIQVFQYDADNLNEFNEFDLKDLKKLRSQDMPFWLNIYGIHDMEKVLKICNILTVHSLVVQDIVDVNQRPKFQPFDEYWFFTINSVISENGFEFEPEHLSFIIGPNYLISFQEKKADYFEHIRYRLRNKLGIIRERGVDYLLYLLLESILDNYSTSIEKIEAALTSLNLIDNDDLSPSIIYDMEKMRRQVHQFKKTIFPIKDFVGMVEREEFGRIQAKHVKYYFELKDLCLMLLDECDQQDLRVESNINLYFSMQGHRMNQVMKTLTVVATIFIPLTFVAGIYGMNFANMPELGWKWGYPVIWLIMIMITFLMLYYFRRKKWF